MIASLLLIAGILPVFGSGIPGAIWTTDSKGRKVNGNLYNNPRDVYLTGGPYKPGALGLPDGEYYFQVTDSSGKTLLSSDLIEDRGFRISGGYITDAEHPTKPFRNGGNGALIVQLWPFVFTAKTGGEYKVWVTSKENYSLEGEGCFGFISSLSKTDNFKVKVPDQVTKYFELWVTSGVYDTDAEFYVDYTVGDPDTGDPEDPWMTGILLYDRAEGTLEVFRYETTFTLGSYVYWQFYFLNEVGLPMEISGPELITGEMANKEFLFRINGHHYNSRPTDATQVPVEGSQIVLSSGTDSVKTFTDSEGYYEFIAVVPEVSMPPWDYRVSLMKDGSELAWFDDQAETPVDWTYDFFSGAAYMSHAQSGDYDKLTEFTAVWTPSNEDDDDGEGLYKLSSTNPGSFHFNIENVQEPGTPVYMEIRLPERGVNNQVYDLPNFLFHHQYIGGTYVIDFHVYDGDSNRDITEDFTILEKKEKEAVIKGSMPDSGIIIVTLHLDFQIEPAIPESYIEVFDGFEYYIEVFISGSGRGMRSGSKLKSGRGMR